MTFSRFWFSIPRSNPSMVTTCSEFILRSNDGKLCSIILWSDEIIFNQLSFFETFLSNQRRDVSPSYQTKKRRKMYLRTTTWLLKQNMCLPIRQSTSALAKNFRRWLRQIIVHPHLSYVMSMLPTLCVKHKSTKRYSAWWLPSALTFCCSKKRSRIGRYCCVCQLSGYIPSFVIVVIRDTRVV